MLAEPLQVVLLVIDALEQLNISYFLGGSLASSLYAIPRATQDVDLVADLHDNHVLPLVDALQGAFYIDGDMIRQAIRYRRSFNVIHLPTMFKVDVFVLKDTALAREEMNRRRSIQVLESPPRSVFVASPEDIILEKLDWYRLGGGVSDRQWGDLLGVLKIQGDVLDIGYIKGWVARLQLEKLLDRALLEAGIEC